MRYPTNSKFSFRILAVCTLFAGVASARADATYVLTIEDDTCKFQGGQASTDDALLLQVPSGITKIAATSEHGEIGVTPQDTTHWKLTRPAEFKGAISANLTLSGADGKTIECAERRFFEEREEAPLDRPGGALVGGSRRCRAPAAEEELEGSRSRQGHPAPRPLALRRASAALQGRDDGGTTCTDRADHAHRRRRHS
jgi:hypothetical protein